MRIQSSEVCANVKNSQEHTNEGCQLVNMVRKVAWASSRNEFKFSIQPRNRNCACTTFVSMQMHGRNCIISLLVREENSQSKWSCTTIKSSLQGSHTTNAQGSHTRMLPSTLCYRHKLRTHKKTPAFPTILSF